VGLDSKEENLTGMIDMCKGRPTGLREKRPGYGGGEVRYVNRVHVKSSNLRSVGYDKETETLEIEFHDGGLYQYFGVPAGTYEGLVTAPSKGSYFHIFIRDRYRYRKLR
jgi:hypothetical protein